MMTSAQIRMARAALQWSVRDLADRSGVHRNTITRLEAGNSAHGPTLAALKQAFESAGVIFVEENGEGAGVRLRKSESPDSTKGDQDDQ